MGNVPYYEKLIDETIIELEHLHAAVEGVHRLALMAITQEENVEIRRMFDLLKKRGLRIIRELLKQLPAEEDV